MILFRDLNKTFKSQDVLDMVRLATYHDLMAFPAVSYRISMSAGLSLKDARYSAKNDIGRFLKSVAHALLLDVRRTMICIAKTVMPAPSAPLLEPLQQQRRLSVAVMSAPPAGYIPQSSSEEDEDADKSTAHDEPDYEEDKDSIHSTPVRHRASARAEAAEIEPRRLTHPRGRAPTGPSSMREAFPERSPPGVKARSPCVRLPIRSPARGSLTRKATNPHLPWSHLPCPLSRLLSSARLRETPTLYLIDENTSISDDQVSLNFFQTHTAAVSLMSLKKI